ncbi:MAG: YtxH domain-containing protein [Gemmatimonadaceae bacterium]
MSRNLAVLACILSLAVLFPRTAEAQANSDCSTDRWVSTLVGAGLGGAAGAIPATIAHRHDQTSSHRIVAVSISAGAVLGFVAAGRDRPCRSHADASHAGDVVLASRSRHASHSALAGVLIGGVVGAAASTLYAVDGNRTRVYVTLFSAGEGAIAGGVLGGLIGWAWPVGR